jgi:hypothetical protein
MVMAGAKLAIGSWKIIEIAPPRTTFMRVRGAATARRPARLALQRDPAFGHRRALRAFSCISAWR